jgi:dTDP-glucose pyrophosphorylase
VADTGTHESLLQAGNFIETMKTAGLESGVSGRDRLPDGYIDASRSYTAAQRLAKTEYGEYSEEPVEREYLHSTTICND